LNIALIVAFVGILGTLVGSAINHYFSVRRETKQWERQRQLEVDRWANERVQEQVRWERERTERQEQWDREDVSRWQKERLAAYAALLGRLERWRDLAERDRPYPNSGPATLNESSAERLRVMAEEIEESLESIELLAPDDIRKRAKNFLATASLFRLSLLEGATDDDEPGDTEEAISNKLAYIARRLSELRNEIRRDLSIKESLPTQAHPGNGQSLSHRSSAQ
jgi:hypothetical protein